MSILTQLVGLALDGAAEATGLPGVGKGVEAVGNLLRKQFADNSRRLPKAIKKAADRAWRAVEVALAGKSWWDRCKVALATGDARAIRSQVQAYLDAYPLDGVEGHGPDFRAQCVAQLQAARKAGLLDRGKIDPAAVVRQVGDLSRFGDPAALLDAEYAVVAAMADGLRRAGYDALATFLCLRPAGGPPLLVAAMRYFFRREVEADPELAQAWSHARTEKLATDQQAGFTDLAQAMDAGMGRIESLLGEVHEVVVKTHGDVLDIKAELARQGRQMNELGQAVLQALAQQKLDRRQLNGGDSLSIRNEDERRLVRGLVRQYRGMPSEERRRMPALLNAVGKLEVMTGDFDAAEKDFREVATMVGDGSAKAEASHNAYLAALERRSYDDALDFLREAVETDPARFAPFPADKYEAERILGAGGFGVAFLCRNRHSGAQVVIKTLRRDGLDRDLGEVFREAQALEELEHPAIIRIRDCDYADAAKTRPFFVMDFFPGNTLADHVEQYGTIEPDEAIELARLMAAGLQKAHARGILHRDVKPGNVIVRSGGSGWEAKLIDFGLALRPAEKGSTARASLDRTLAGASIAGTLEYAAPEQMGRLPGVAVGTYSDVYGFGKTCCFALFGTPQPTFQHWKALPPRLAELLGRCLDEKPRSRPQDFAEVLRELDRKPERVPLQETSAPEKTARPKPRREPEPAPRRRDDRDGGRGRDRDGRREKPLLDGKVIALGVGVLIVVVGFVSIGIVLATRRTPPVASTPSTTQPAAGQVGFGTGTTKPQPLPSGFPAPGVRPAAPAPRFGPFTVPDLSQIRPLDSNDFAAALAELRANPEPARRREIAARLIKTSPKRLAKDDEIQQVSLGLQPLLDSNDTENCWYGASACRNWGTSANVVALIGIANKTGFDADTTRRTALRALGAIGDPRGIPAVIERMKDASASLRESDDLLAALEGFGSKAESSIWPLLEKTAGGKPTSPFVRRFAVRALGKIGTANSIDVLERNQDFFVKEETAAALLQIRARYAK